jgi:outer membrane protein assembly factor BamB
MKTYLFYLALAAMAFTIQGQTKQTVKTGMAEVNNNSPSQFRGENCSGIASPDAVPPINLLLNENMAWKTEIASGISSPCILGDKIFLTGSNPSDSALITYCIDRETGKILWERTVFPESLESIHPVGSQAASTPTAGGQHVFVYFGSYGVICYDFEGNPVWEKRLPLVESMYGSCASPIIADGKLILYRKEKNGSTLYAFNPATGVPVWETVLSFPPILEEDFNQSHSTPVVWNNHVIIHQMMGLTAVSIEDGTERWTIGVISNGTSTPLIVRDFLYVNGYTNFGESRLHDKFPEFHVMLSQYDLNRDNLLQIAEMPEDKALFRRPGLDLPYHYDTLFTWKMAARGFDTDKNGVMDEPEWNQMKEFWSKWFLDHGVVAVALKPDKPEIIWKENEYVAEVPSLLCAGDQVYMITNGGIMTCMDPETGEVIFREKIGASGAYLASPLLANGHIYFASYNGVITVVKPDASLNIISRLNLKERIASSPVAAGNMLYLRTSGGLYAFE